MSDILLRGRLFTSDDLEVIVRCVDKHYTEGRTRISEIVCQELDWRQPNGWLKDRACRDVLRKLDSLGLIKLPPPLTKSVNRHNDSTTPPQDVLADYDLETPITEMPDSLSLELAKGNYKERVWNALIEEYHYLGHKVAVGRCLKYLLLENNNLLGAIAFSSPAWALAPRDSLLQFLGITSARMHDIIINNSRFLILPRVQVPNLASRVLAMSTRRVTKDWHAYYAIKPLIVETFIQPSLYSGTSYLAANWIEIGVTKGYAKRGSSYHNSQEPKTILLYGLNRHIRRKLRAVRVRKE